MSDNISSEHTSSTEINSLLSIKTLSNGMAVIVEEMPDVESAACEIHVPGGLVRDQADRIGASLILTELTTRGAGKMSSRELSEAFDEQGIRHSESALHDRHVYRSAMVADCLPSAMEYISLMVQQPRLPDAELANIKSMLIQDLDSLQDNPAHRASVELAQRYYPEPFNRPHLGTRSGIEECTIDEIKSLWKGNYASQGAVFSVAGNVRAPEVFDLVNKYFGAWQGTPPARPEFGAMPKHSKYHIEEKEAAQLQIVMAMPAANFGHRHYYTAKVLTGILSGGMFGRLFIEVREKRGLCYSVHARHSSTKDYGTFTVYAGTTPERAHETLEVSVAELKKIAGSVSDEELDRSKANILSSLVMGEESSGSRCSSNAADYWLDQRVRPMDEVKQAILAVDQAAIEDYVSQFGFDSFSLLTLGARELDWPGQSASL